MSLTQRSRNQRQLVTMWNEKTDHPRENFIELGTFQRALNYLERYGWFDREER